MLLRQQTAAVAKLHEWHIGVPNAISISKPTTGGIRNRLLILAMVSIAGLTGTIVKADPAQTSVDGGRIAHIWMAFEDYPGVNTLNSYSGFIRSLRDAVGVDVNNGYRVTQSQANALVRADINVTNGPTLRLWFDPQNLYLLGYTTASNETFGFSDSNLRQIMTNLQYSPDAGLLPPLDRVHLMYFSGNYIPLSGAARTTRLDQHYSWNSMWDHLWNLAYANDPYGPNQTEVARSLLYMIQATSEAARFWDVFGRIAETLTNAGRVNIGIGSMQSDLENAWSHISQWARDWANGLNPAPLVVGAAVVFATIWDVIHFVGIGLGPAWRTNPNDDWGKSQLRPSTVEAHDTLRRPSSPMASTGACSLLLSPRQ